MNKKSINGFSLMELMVTVGLGGIMALALVNLSANLQSKESRVKSSTDINIFINDVLLNLSQSNSCVATFNGIDVTSATTIPSIRDKYNKIILQQGKTYLEGKVIVERIGVQEFNITNPAGAIREAQLSLELDFRIKANNKIQSKIISITMNIDSSNRVTKCNQTIGNSKENFLQTFCDRLGGTIRASDGKCELESATISPVIGASTKFVIDYINNLNYDSILVKLSGDTMLGPLVVNSDVKTNSFCLAGVCGITLSSTSCPPSQVAILRTGTNTLSCISLSCPSGYLLTGINSSNSLICQKLPDETCGNNAYVSAIDSSGNVTCSQIPPNSAKICPNGQYIQSIDANGVLTCAIDSSGISMSCPNGDFIQSISGNTVSCANGPPSCSPTCPSPSTICSGSIFSGSNGCGGSCSVNGTKNCGVNGVCNNSSVNSCSSGDLVDIADSSINYLWNCAGSSGGSAANCSKAKPIDFCAANPGACHWIPEGSEVGNPNNCSWNYTDCDSEDEMKPCTVDNCPGVCDPAPTRCVRK